MKIRTQVVALVAGVAVPLVLLAVFVTVQLWQQLHEGYQQQFLERASAVRLALDTEFDVTVRTLRTVGDAAEIPSLDAEVVLQRRFRRLLDNYPDWAAVFLTDAQGHVTMTSARPGASSVPLLNPADVRRTLTSNEAFISNVTIAADGRPIVFIAAAIVREGRTQGVIFVAIQHSHWLDLLRTYPVSRRGVLTLLDRDSTVVARTLNDDQWVGKKSPSAYWARTVNRSSGVFKANGLDGAAYYAAFSRSLASGWVLSSGVPQEEVDDALFWQTAAVLVVAIAAICGALVTAWRLGKDINVSLLGLLSTANAIGDKAAPAAAVLPIGEARTVQDALVGARSRLLERETALSDALERENAARHQAESGSRAKDQFLAMMGHELRNPLSAITAAAQLLEADPGTAIARQRGRDIVLRQAGHLASMIDNLMDVAQLASGEIVLHKARLDLAQIAAKVLQRFSETGRSEHLQMRTEHVPAWIDADPARIELLITCLLDNACKYTPPGGTVTVVVRGEPGASTLTIQDTGAGIAADALGSVFDAFSQGRRGIERAEGGLGLGLALARRLVLLHGGVVTVRSDGVSMGATFAITFPSVEAPSLAYEEPAEAARDLLITVVEDIADNREMLVLLLSALGRRVNEAADGPSGVETILAGPSDVALVDIGLPGFDGLEVARRVRDSSGGDRVLLVALTGYGTDSDRENAMAAGFDEFLVKPFSLDSFEAALARRAPLPGAKGKAG